VATRSDQWLVDATASAISNLMPGTMLLPSADSWSWCGIWPARAPIATAGIPMLTAMLASVEPMSAGTMAGVPGLRKWLAIASAVCTSGWCRRSAAGRAFE